MATTATTNFYGGDGKDRLWGGNGADDLLRPEMATDKLYGDDGHD